MQVVVLLKQTFDTEEQIVIENGVIANDDAKWIINPYDEYAVEEAVRIKEELGAAVSVITLGPKKSEEALRTALAMGADQAIHIVTDPGFRGDEFVVAKILAATVRKMPFDLVLAGNMAVDGGSAQVGPRVAEELGIDHVASVVKLEIDGEQVKVERDAESGLEKIDSQLPLLITTQQGLNEPRYPSLPNMMKAKRKPIKNLYLEDIFKEIFGESTDSAAKTAIVDRFLPSKKKMGRLLEGTLRQQTAELVQILSDEEKVV